MIIFRCIQYYFGTKSKFECFLANDNSKGQLILSGKHDELNKFAILLKEKKIKNIKLPVSAPFHCELMKEATIS